MSTTSTASTTVNITPHPFAIPPPQERSFQLRNGLVIRAKHWRSAGPEVIPRDCRRFIAFHGYLDNAGSFDPLAPLLLEQLGPEPVEILALDLAGHGMSDHRTSEDYALWRYIEDADQIVEQLGWQKHAIIGHSMGGAISTLYAGLYESRVTLCVLLDNMGPLTRSVEDQPQHLLEHIADKKNLLTKRTAFHPTVESACQARSQGGAYGIAPEFAELLMPRGLRPAERTSEDGKTVVQGWTWSTDRLLTIRSAQSMSEDYAKAFMTRITCPVFAVMAEGGLFHLKDVMDQRLDWVQKGKLTLTSVPGKHSVHMENAPLVASKIVPWILAQDIGEVAKL
ncbi:hypothetical protein BGZ95_001280 [Linnemannia exigua]|uniref:AB hydrolase-1 domain-containing protein n=1 Tax=Linnemannia exigua TaxID=604196 RepID=A0AAD4D729_9FUNG|nr:hypothetical protein BGZ95_001280 [Linnemannia exigua]